jgi:GNAT superfamily N-acetyltransferase
VSLARFVACDPEESPASELLAEMAVELNALYERADRLDLPVLSPTELRPPAGTYVVGWEGRAAVAGGGVRHLDEGVAEIKRMFVRPAARSRGIAGELLTALECAARSLGYRSVRLDTGPKQEHAERLYRRAGFAPIGAYNDNPFASFWGEKDLDLAPA